MLPSDRQHVTFTTTVVMASKLLRLAPIAIIFCLLYLTLAQDTKSGIRQADVGTLSTQEIEEQLQV